jgi:hypothetical protein
MCLDAAWGVRTSCRDGWNQIRPELRLHEIIKVKRSFSMPKKISHSKSSASKSAPKKSAPAVTLTRNSPVPRPAAPKREVTHEMIAKRAYEIYRSGSAGDQLGNWLRAERELRAL